LGHIFEDDAARTKEVLRFIVNEDGTISDIIVRRSISPKIDRQAVDMVKSFPKFKPALDLKNKPVKAAFMFPLQLELSNK
jgi:outer membrane biosynthesis protein TonB